MRNDVRHAAHAMLYAMLAMAGEAIAQEPYPNKPVSLVVRRVGKPD